MCEQSVIIKEPMGTRSDNACSDVPQVFQRGGSSVTVIIRVVQTIAARWEIVSVLVSWYLGTKG